MPNVEVCDCTFNAKGYAYFDCETEDQWVEKNEKEGGITKYKQVIKCRVKSGPHAGKHLYWEGWLTTAAWPYTQEKLEKCFGFTGQLRNIKTANERKDFVGHEVNVSVKTEDYKGEDKLKVAGIYPVRQSIAAADWDDLMASHGETVQPTFQPKREPVYEQQSAPDDGLPF